MIKVASYCRVSTNKEDQANSFESQQQYFKDYITSRPDWELYQVYADEGITGTSTKKRVAFHQMINDARKGAFQLILTKEVSRFSRNILDTICYTRELKELGVGILFLNDGINTLEPDAELRLSIMGSIAQEESRRTSVRVKWGQTRRMEQGIVFGRSLLGYTVKNGQISVNPKEAELVRLIFHKYGVEKKGTTAIAHELKEAGYCTRRGNTVWRPGCIIKLLKNEKYVGDLVQKKTVTLNYLSHAKTYNHGEEDLIIIRDHHEPIISRELWNSVQSELEKRNRNGTAKTGHSNRFLFSGKIKCGQCGANFVARKRYRKDGTAYRRWSCLTAINEGTFGCDVGKTLRDEAAMDILRQALNTLQLDREQFVDETTAIAYEALLGGQHREREVCTASLELELDRLLKKRDAALDAFLAHDISKKEMRQMTKQYDSEIKNLKTQLESAKIEVISSECRREDIRGRIAAIMSGKCNSESFWKKLLSNIVVYRDRRVEVTLSLLPQTWVFELRHPT